MKGYQVRGEGLCFQPGAQKSQFKLWRTTFDDKFYIEFWDGCGDGGGRGGRDARPEGVGGAERSNDDWRVGTERNSNIEWLINKYFGNIEGADRTAEPRPDQIS